MTFREAAANYMKWARETKMKNTDKSRDFWNQREQLIGEHILPVFGDRTMGPAIAPDIQHSAEAGIRAMETGEGEEILKQRLEAVKVAMSVCRHHMTGRG